MVLRWRPLRAWDPLLILKSCSPDHLLYIWWIDVSFSCVCPVIDHEFHHNIVKVAEWIHLHPDSLYGQTDVRDIITKIGSADYFDNVMTKFIVNNRTDAWKTDINLFFTITKRRGVKIKSNHVKKARQKCENFNLMRAMSCHYRILSH